MLRDTVVVSALLALLPLNSPAALPNEPENSDEREFTVEQIAFFETHVRPVLIAHCYECHSTDARELKAGLYVDSRHGMLQGGESGPAIVAGSPDESRLIAAIKYESNEMPPDGKLSDVQIDTLVRWVEMGAPWPDFAASPVMSMPVDTIDWTSARASHWAWKAVEQPSLPDNESNEAVNAIDFFVSARRKQAGLAPNARGEPALLARRIYIDLIGVLPTPEQVTTFIGQASENRQLAVQALVDQLLQSPMYGQRWARHWLDVARYSDGHGGFLDAQGISNAWRYRDWVVDALNANMPIDEFFRLQIAGDIVGESSDAVATGFFALGPAYHSDGGDPDSQAQAEGETLDDRIDLLTRGLLGITGACARCHDHKFDPIPQQDYYSIAGVFHNTATQDLPLAEQDVVERFDQYRKAVEDLNEQIDVLKKKLQREKRQASEDEQQQLDSWGAEIEAQKENSPPCYHTAHTLKDAGSKDMHVAIRGNLRKTGEVAPRRFLRILAGPDPPKFTVGSGRAELAAAIIDPGNPLTARVFVNRVWMHHFGAGLVRTPSNFGMLGEPPTHPLLLDWLAADFVQHDWSLKRLHRQIITSATYQLSSAYSPEAYERDRDNRLLWRMSPRRMDIEAWRDCVLDVTGELDYTPGGPPSEDISRDLRRTLYAKVSRNGDVFPSDAFLRRFDFPLMRATVAKRPQSIVPQQFLFFLNSDFMVARAQALTARLHKLAEKDEQRIEVAYQLLYSRKPSEVEASIGQSYVKSGSGDEQQLSAWERYAQTLLSSNEFMFIR